VFSNVLEFSGKDGCIYVFDLDKKYWYRVYPVDKVPSEIRNQVYEHLESAKAVAEALKDAI